MHRKSTVPRSDHASENRETPAPQNQPAPETPSPAGALPFSEQSSGESKLHASVEKMMDRDFSGLAVTSHADGRKSLKLGGRFLHLSALVPTADGREIVQCFSSHEELESGLRNPRPVNERTQAIEPADF